MSSRDRGVIIFAEAIYREVDNETDKTRFCDSA